MKYSNLSSVIAMFAAMHCSPLYDFNTLPTWFARTQVVFLHDMFDPRKVILIARGKEIKAKTCIQANLLS